MKYCLAGDVNPIYERDENGNIVYIVVDNTRVAVKTGETQITYHEPVEFYGCISSQLENAIVRAFGSDSSNNYAVLVVAKGQLPDITIGTKIWRTSTLTRRLDGTPDPSTADYTVTGILDEELNEDSYYLQKENPE